MNYKLEKFWNDESLKKLEKIGKMNYKLEKFWNLTYYKEEIEGKVNEL